MSAIRLLETGPLGEVLSTPAPTPARPTAERRLDGWSKALTLAERAALWREGAAKPEVDEEKAELRVRRWRSQAPFPTERYFEQRLALERLTEREFRALLGEECPLKGVRPTVPPDWLTELEEAFAGGPPAPPLDAPWPADLQRRRAAGFLRLAQPLLWRGLSRITDGVATLPKEDWEPPFCATTIGALLIPNVLPRLLWLVSRVVVLELNVARLRSELDGKTPEERFEAFVERLGRPEEAFAIFREYPVLARQLVGHIGRWVRTSLEFLGRLHADWGLIRARLSPDRPPGRLVQATAGAGDSHRGGRSVVILAFESGFRLVYKPRSLAVDKHFSELVGWLNARGNPVQFRAPEILDHGPYGWSEFVTSAGCQSEAEVRRFYERQGGYIALLYALEATDFHAENLVAVGEHPMLIDLEALFHPRLPTPQTIPAGSTTAFESMGHSVLRTGLLPQRLWSNADFDGVDLSGLGGEPGQLSPHPIPSWEKEGTDEMHLVRHRVRMTGRQNRPSLNGREVYVPDYRDALIFGFTATYESLLRHRRGLLADDGPLSRFMHDEIRAVLRPTRTYGLLLNESFHPDVLRDALDRDRLFDRLWVGVEHQPHLAGLIPAERQDLHDDDIPLFVCRPASRDLWTSRGERLADFLSEPSGVQVTRRLEQLSPQDLSRQAWFIRAALTTLMLGEQPTTWSGVPLKRSRAKIAEPAGLLRLVRAIADRLETLALRGDAALSWVGVTLVNDRVWQLLPVGGDLYSGLSGIALFLAHAGIFAGEERYTILARAAIGEIQRLVEQQGRPAGGRPVGAIGGFNGWGGVIYALGHLGALWDDRQLIADARSLVDVVSALLPRDDHLDIVSGAAGGLAALLALDRLAPAPSTLELAINCGDHLLARAQTMDNGVAWKTPMPATQPLTGFSHGAAGVAWSLMELSNVTGETRFREAALEAIAYERSQFVPDLGNWPDFRKFDGAPADEGGRPKTMVTWCHGAPGIALARAAGLRHEHDPRTRRQLEADLEVALETTERHGFGMNHSLCHGDLGNLEAMLLAGHVLGDGRWRRRCEELTADVLESIEENGWRCGIPFGVENPGLMTGLAGIGYELLRLMAPDRVPSVLLLEPPHGS